MVLKWPHFFSFVSNKSLHLKNFISGSDILIFVTDIGNALFLKNVRLEKSVKQMMIVEKMVDVDLKGNIRKGIKK